MRNNIIFVFFIALYLTSSYVQSVLYPYESEARETKSLNGLWDFTLLPDGANLRSAEEFLSVINRTQFSDYEIIKMPVPSSFNDITTNASIRDYIGYVLYSRDFYVPKSWKEGKIFIHFGSVHYTCFVYVNNVPVAFHAGGHIPFQAEVTSQVNSGLNNIKVLVNNILFNFSLPQGYYKHEHPDWHPSGFSTYSHNCDYFDYAGINRPVTLFTTPSTSYISNISVDTGFFNDIGYVEYDVDISVHNDVGKDVDCKVILYDKYKNIVNSSVIKSVERNFDLRQCSGVISVENVELWWPVMSKNTDSWGYLYTLEIRLDEDVYRLPVGIRTIQWTNTSLLINNVPIYIKGFGMHEDSDIRGRGFDNVILARDLNLIKWLGVNSFRTSHYPYADETLNEADSLGLMVILETPACSLDKFDESLLNEHKRILNKIIDHHKNRPSVIMWSLANEPSTNLNTSEPYFKQLVELTHAKDKSRPVTFVSSQSSENDRAVKFVDIICFNRYNGWYTYQGRLDLIKDSIIGEVTNWRKNYSKPIIITEYGAGSYIGQHNLPARMWNEDYQVLLLNEHFKAFDILRAKGFFIGEMIWNFIDFQVPQEYFRPGKCDKGLFTRDRQPKPAAYIVRERYRLLPNEIIANFTMNCDKHYSSFNDISVDLV